MSKTVIQYLSIEKCCRIDTAPDRDDAIDGTYYRSYETALSASVARYLSLGKAVKVYTNLMGQTIVEEIPDDSACHPYHRYRTPSVSDPV